MIAFLRGTLVDSLPTHVLIDVGGVGYQVHIPSSTYERLPATASQVKIHTYWHLHERGQALYGFFSVAERDLFLLLINQVSGLGPKLGLSILSGMSVENFQQAVVSGDLKALSSLKGVGKKTAERIMVELKDKVGVTQVWSTQAGSPGTGPRLSAHENDALLALIALGYKQQEAYRALEQCRKQDGWPESASVQDWLKGALRHLQ
jgi:Holliday junction DNA helicase RuvA